MHPRVSKRLVFDAICWMNVASPTFRQCVFNFGQFVIGFGWSGTRMDAMGMFSTLTGRNNEPGERVGTMCPPFFFLVSDAAYRQLMKKQLKARQQIDLADQRCGVARVGPFIAAFAIHVPGRCIILQMYQQALFDHTPLELAVQDRECCFDTAE